ncbi:dienelactone hydrolase family protein [Lacibacter sediminis]|nr:dienelactone hydrolase family protein [Lacibacter sediminis]
MMNFRFNSETDIPLGTVVLQGELIVPLNAEGIVIFSHGSGSSRHSPRNRRVAAYLHEQNFGTLLFDLLTIEEDRRYQNRFDIRLLTQRLYNVTKWLEKHPAALGCSIGYFGASTGAASALQAAAHLPEIAAVVSRGGRPDLANDELHKVTAPTLLLVGGEDVVVLELNRQAFEQLTCVKRLDIVEGATHLFEEEGKMEIVEKLAAKWFQKYLQPVNA